MVGFFLSTTIKFLFSIIPHFESKNQSAIRLLWPYAKLVKRAERMLRDLEMLSRGQIAALSSNKHSNIGDQDLGVEAIEVRIVRIHVEENIK